jgi:hypothetical protein
MKQTKDKNIVLTTDDKYLLIKLTPTGSIVSNHLSRISDQQIVMNILLNVLDALSYVVEPMMESSMKSRRKNEQR